MLDMGRLSNTKLARKSNAFGAEAYNGEDEHVLTKFSSITGLREGEKIHEELSYKDELVGTVR